MLSIEQCRQILGKEATSLSDKQIRRLRDNLDLLADVLFDNYLNHVKSDCSAPKTRAREERVDTGRESGILKKNIS